MKPDQQAPTPKNPDKPLLRDEAERDNDERWPNDPMKRKHDRESVEEALEDLHDKARPL